MTGGPLVVGSLASALESIELYGHKQAHVLVCVGVVSL